MKKLLSKSTFVRGLQCEKSLYLYKNHFNLKDTPSLSLKTIFEQGTSIGLLAQHLFPGGVDASTKSYININDSVKKTFDFINQGETTIYEATFIYNNVLAALDILVKKEDGWHAYEVKSSTRISSTYLNDAAIQYYTIINSGINLKDISIIYINKNYLMNENIDVSQLFNIESVYDKVLKLNDRIPKDVNRFKKVLMSSKAPNVDIGTHCSKPYECDFKGVCWNHIPDYSIFDISRLSTKKKFDLYKKGIVKIDQVDINKTPLNSDQLIQVQSDLNNKTYIETKKIKKFIKDLKYPLFYLDFETISSAIPMYKNTKPYQQLVFQYSLHVQKSINSKIVHSDYLANQNEDPRSQFIERLINDCGGYGDIIVYNISFERGKLKNLIKNFPNYSLQLTSIINRLKDLMLPFKNKWYYSPKMKGSYSIKYVLPALVPDLSYDNLDIKDGGTASNIFLSMVNGTFNGNVKETRKQLLEYCYMDTFAMVKILEKLIQI